MATRNAGFLAIATLMAIASVLLSWLSYNPWGMMPPLAAIFDCTAVTTLAIFMVANGRRSDYITFAAILALIALGRLLLAADANMARILLSIAHIAAMAYYLRQIRKVTSLSQKLLAMAMVILIPTIIWLSSTQPQAVLYAAIIAGMAAACWISRFPRYVSGIGVILYATADLILVAGSGNDEMMPIWANGLYLVLYLGLFLQSFGIVRTLKKDERAPLA